MHIPCREEIIPCLASALKPGGWLLLEEHDIYPVFATACGSYRQVWNASTKGMVDGGAAVDRGRQLPLLLAKQGLSDVGAEGDIRMFPGASPMAEFWRLSFEQVRERIEAFLVAKDALDDTLKMLGDPRHWFTGPAVCSAWGRRPWGSDPLRWGIDLESQCQKKPGHNRQVYRDANRRHSRVQNQQ